jgi:hypothetical protein
LDCRNQIPKQINYGILGQSVSYHQDGDFFSENFDGEIFSIRRQCALEIEQEIGAREHREK